MESYFNILQKTTVTGFIIFLLGLLTLTPEIYIPGIVVMLISSTSTVTAFEIQRLESHQAPMDEPPANHTYYSW